MFCTTMKLAIDEKPQYDGFITWFACENYKMFTIDVTP